MESVCRITHYQTSFIIDACPPEESAPFILATLWKWLWHQKERLPMDESLAQIQADFEAGALNRSLAMPRNHIRTLRHELEDRTLWGMEYTERPDPEDSLHASEEGDWLTEVGMTVLRKPESGKPRVVLCVRSSVSPWTANFKDPYPVIPPSISGMGFIHPPDFLASRNRFPIYKKELCYPPPHFIKELRASERGPQPYIPDKYNRLEGGYKLRERMAYSHPDYH